MNIIEKQITNNIINDTIDENIIDENIINKNEDRGPSCELIIIDNFYINPIETRNYILTQDFNIIGNFPGKRTISYATEELKNMIQRFVEPFAGKIVDFPIPNDDNSNNYEIYNGCFQYTTSRERSWIHTDKWNNWAGIVYLTPDAPLSSGTGFYKFKDGSMNQTDGDILNNQEEVNKFNQDLTKWELVDRVGNVFNRLILFNSQRYHVSLDYFGDTKENGRLFQVFFFSTSN